MDAHTAPESSINSDNSVPSRFMRRPSTQAPQQACQGSPAGDCWTCWGRCGTAAARHKATTSDESWIPVAAHGPPISFSSLRPLEADIMPNKVVWLEAEGRGTIRHGERHRFLVSRLPCVRRGPQRSFGTMAAPPRHRWRWLPRCVFPRGTSRLGYLCIIFLRVTEAR